MDAELEADTVSVELDGEPQVTFSSTSPTKTHVVRLSRGSDGRVYAMWDGMPLETPPTVTGAHLTPTRLVVTYQFAGPRKGRRFYVVGHRTRGSTLIALRKGLRRVFRGTGVFIDDAATGLSLLKAIVIGPPTPTSELLVVPFYMTVVGVIGGVIVTAEINPWLIPVGVVAGAVLGFVVGYLKRRRFYSLHKYQ